jgi:hypothetical protein
MMGGAEEWDVWDQWDVWGCARWEVLPEWFLGAGEAEGKRKRREEESEYVYVYVYGKEKGEEKRATLSSFGEPFGCMTRRLPATRSNLAARCHKHAVIESIV